MAFKKKRLWTYWNLIYIFSKTKDSFISFMFFIKLSFISFSLFLIFYFANYAISFWQNFMSGLSNMIMSITESTVWEDLNVDEFWQINALILWYDHWYLADSIIVASYDVDLWSVSFLSIPRDLYISNPDVSYNWKINWLLPTIYNRTWEVSEWLNALISTINEITWINIDYYALIDFDWFIKLVDSLWWVEVDVPEKIVDHKYPTANWWYQTFIVEEWIQKFDWETALKYARSRQTTSDFSRSIRQQLLIKSIISQIVSVNNLVNIPNLQKLYWEFNSMLETNISFRQIISLISYVKELDIYNSAWLTADCDKSYFETTDIWCFLYYPQRSLFGWASVLLQQWANVSDFSNYKNIQDFAFFFLNNQEYLLEKPSIKVVNAVDPKTIRSKHWRLISIANNMAIELKQYWFDVIDTWNSDEYYEKNIVYVDDLNSYKSTISLLRIFIDIDEVLQSNELDAHMEIYLWNKFIEN